jgi:PTS system N-acetylglucosamine-specific IIC component
VLTGDGARARGFIDALGGPANLVSVDACTTRLRLVVADQNKVNAPVLKALGARGIIKPSPRDLQVVLGPIADQVAREMKELLGAGVALAPAAAGTTVEVEISDDDRSQARSMLAALGGGGNIRTADPAANRVLLGLANAALIDPETLKGLGVRGVARPTTDTAQLLLDRPAGGVAKALEELATA